MFTPDQYRNLLLTNRRHAPLALADVNQAGLAFFGDADAIRLYGMRPSQYLRAGCRLLGRTAVEACLDQPAVQLAQALRATVGNVQPAIVDLFLGSGNLLSHLARACRAPRAIGFEADREVLECTRSNLHKLRLPGEAKEGSFVHGLPRLQLPTDATAVVVVDPPWGDGFSFAHGLDLRRTAPPVPRILDFIAKSVRCETVFALVKTHELLVEAGVVDIAARWPIIMRGVTTGMKTGTNVGYLICRVK